MAMHAKNILHRDIKTQNIFITKNNVLKIGDFGISKELDTLNKMALTSCGTPYFMPPEVC
jgi:NIMA (never in mitosis gene a)-related kinase